jgi:enoyl-CoA hydratase/carnithine racemase
LTAEGAAGREADMKQFQGECLSWERVEGVIELALQREPCNEIGSATLAELEKFAGALDGLAGEAHALIVYSTLRAGFSAGADLRELYLRSQEMKKARALAGVRDFLQRIHGVFNKIDAVPLTTIAAVHGVTFGGGFELALVCDLIVADKTARFCFPELRLGLVPGFGGIPRLKRDLGNGVVRDLLLTGRSFNTSKAQAAGLLSQVVAEGEALQVARATAAQLGKFDRQTATAAKKFIKPIPYDELKQEIDIFCELFTQPAVEEGLRRFVESREALPYLP